VKPPVYGIRLNGKAMGPGYASNAVPDALDAAKKHAGGLVGPGQVVEIFDMTTGKTIERL
jgi:hypothetical protein